MTTKWEELKKEYDAIVKTKDLIADAYIALCRKLENGHEITCIQLSAINELHKELDAAKAAIIASECKLDAALLEQKLQG